MKRYAVLLCAEDSEYVKKKYGGYFGVFVGLLGEEGEIWDVYKVARGEFPSDDEIDLFDGFVITGSCNDAHGTDLWICKLLALLKKLDSMKKKVLGICFGHQIRELPPKAEVIAWSETTGIEMFRYGEHFMGIQGHPEYNKDILHHLIDRLVQLNYIMEAYGEEVKATLVGVETDREAWKQLCIKFLKGRL